MTRFGSCLFEPLISRPTKHEGQLANIIYIFYIFLELDIAYKIVSHAFSKVESALPNPLDTIKDINTNHITKENTK